MTFPPFFAYILTVALYGLGAAFLVVPLIGVNIHYAKTLGLVDWPKNRGINEQHVPIIGYSLVSLALLCIAWECGQGRVHSSLFWTGLVIALMGYFDDLHAFNAMPKLVCQVGSALFVVYSLPEVREALNGYGPWSTAVGVFFLVGMMNAVNFIDGIDGLAGIVLISGTLGFLFLGYPFGELRSYLWIAAVFLGTLVPFLYMNVVKRSGFMGNVGSYFFSFLLGVSHLSLPMESRYLIPKLSISVLCFLIPVADSLTVIVLRLLTGRSPMQPDKGHLHHRLVRTGLNLRYILMIFASLAFSGLALAWVMSKEPSVRGTWVPFLVAACEVVTTSLLVLLVEKASRRRVQEYLKSLGAGEKVHFASYRLKNKHGVTQFTWTELKRIEALLNTEIRISDLCYVDAPNHVFLVTRGEFEAFQRMQWRVHELFLREELTVIESADVGEYRQVLGKKTSLKKSA